MRSCQEMQPWMKVETGNYLPTAPIRLCYSSSKWFFICIFCIFYACEFFVLMECPLAQPLFLILFFLCLKYLFSANVDSQLWDVPLIGISSPN